MVLCKVIGTATATEKDVELKRGALLVVKPIRLTRDFLSASEWIALDYLGAGVGDVVLVAQEGAVVEQIFRSPNIPTNTVIVAIVDNFSVTE